MSVGIRISLLAWFMIASLTNAPRADDGFHWQTLESGALRVHWYDGDATFGAAALAAAQAGVESTSRFIAPDLGQPVDIFIYGSVDDLRSALPPGEEDWVAGHADPARGIIRLVIEPGVGQGIQMEQRIPHEMMHVMLYRKTGAGYQNLPLWLREGTAVLAELYPNLDYDRILLDAAAKNDLVPLKELCIVFPAGTAQAFLAYAESRSFVSYLHQTYGSSGLLTLADLYADGLGCERGPEQAFGVSLVALEQEWRVSALGQNNFRSTIAGLSPYLVLLCLVLIIPLAGIVSTLRRKGNPHESRK